MISPMRRGLKQKRDGERQSGSLSRQNDFPDEKGIETFQSQITVQPQLQQSQNDFPDEKGIETIAV